MTGTPTPEAVEPISDADLAERTKWLDCNGPAMANLTVGEARAIIARLRLAESRALPAPRRYTGGPLEDGLYLWRRQMWPAIDAQVVGIVGDEARFGTKPPKSDAAAGGAVWLTGPIHIPDPEEEAANG